MKKPILLLAITTLLAGGISLLAKPKVEKADAVSTGYHFFVQVEKESDLKVGDTVFIGTIGGTIFSALSGNPVFASESHVSGRSEDGKKYYTYYTENYQEMLLMRAEAGAYDGTWSFKSLRTSAQEADYAHPTKGRYLAYGTYYEDEKYHGIQTYGDINMASSKNQYTSWTLEFRGEEKNVIMKYHGEKYDTHIQWYYMGKGARNNFGYYTGHTDIVMYKEVSADQGLGEVEIIKLSTPDQSTVYEGDYLDLTGLELQITLKKGTSNEITFTSVYENEPSFYNVNFAAKDATFVYCSYVGWNFLVPVEVIEDTSSYIYYNEVKTQKADYRGAYLIVYQNGTDIMQLTRVGAYINYSKQSEDGAICSTFNSSIQQHVFNIVHVKISGTTYMFLKTVSTDAYVIRKGDDDIQFVTDINDVTTSDAVTIDSDLSIHIGDKILYYAYNFYLGDNPDMNSRAKLYKHVVDYTEPGSNASTFLTNFANQTSSNCDASGDTETTLTSNIWNGLKILFDNIASDISNGYDFQGYLANTTYVHNAEAGTNSVRDLIDRYDFILAKYSSSKGFVDFMDRMNNSAYQDNYNQASNVSINVFSNQDNTLMIVIIAITSVTLLSLAALMVSKKKKKQ